MSTVAVTPSQLVTINLRFGAHARPLKSLAFTDLALNALFSLNRDATTDDVVKEVARLLARPQIDSNLIAEALRDMRSTGKVTGTNNRWKLSEASRKEVEEERGGAEKVLVGVLERHFPGAIKSELLREWFLAASSDFFGFNAAELLKSISKNTTAAPAKPQSVRDLLKPSIQSYKLGAYEDTLVGAFIAFLSSDHSDDRKYVINLGFALLSALLVSADLGADPITIEEIRGATFVLDTNTLFAIQLDAHRLAKSMHALGLALKEIGVELVFLNATKQEYTRVHTGRKGEVMSFFRDYPKEVILDADDDFIESAIARGCEKAEDFDTFFEQIRILPTELAAGPAISEKDNNLIEAEAVKAQKDTLLKQMIQKYCMQLRAKWDRRPKSEAALKHDAVLIRVTEQLQKDKAKTWVLSLDRGLRFCAAERAGAHSIPVVFMLDGLIQILAVHTGGPKYNAADFAPLLTSIMLNRCNPSERTYNLHDLRWLHSLHERVSDFSPEEIKKLATIITQHRFGGAAQDDKKMQLAVQRAYQEVKQDYNEREEKARRRAETAEQQVNQMSSTLAVYKKHDCVRDAQKVLRRALCWRVPVALGISAISFIFAWLALPATSPEYLNWGASLIAFVAVAVGLCTTPIRTYFSDVKVCISTHV